MGGLPLMSAGAYCHTLFCKLIGRSGSACLRRMQSDVRQRQCRRCRCCKAVNASMCSEPRRRGSAPQDDYRDLQESLRRRAGHVLALSAVAIVTPTPNEAWADLCSNYVFRVGFWGWFTAQTAKIFTRRFKTGIWDLTAFVDSGGMPSSHSALCTAVTTAVAFQFGLGSALFAVALCFSLVVMYDAAGVRRHAGKQAEVLNVVLEDVLHAHPISEQRMKEVLGHTPLQVVTGAILGVLVGCLVPVPAIVTMG